MKREEVKQRLAAAGVGYVKKAISAFKRRPKQPENRLPGVRTAEKTFGMIAAAPQNPMPGLIALARKRPLPVAQRLPDYPLSRRLVKREFRSVERAPDIHAALSGCPDIAAVTALYGDLYSGRNVGNRLAQLFETRASVLEKQAAAEAQKRERQAAAEAAKREKEREQAQQRRQQAQKEAEEAERKRKLEREKREAALAAEAARLAQQKRDRRAARGRTAVKVLTAPVMLPAKFLMGGQCSTWLDEDVHETVSTVFSWIGLVLNTALCMAMMVVILFKDQFMTIPFFANGKLLAYALSAVLAMVLIDRMLIHNGTIDDLDLDAGYITFLIVIIGGYLFITLARGLGSGCGDCTQGIPKIDYYYFMRLLSLAICVVALVVAYFVLYHICDNYTFDCADSWGGSLPVLVVVCIVLPLVYQGKDFGPVSDVGKAANKMFGVRMAVLGAGLALFILGCLVGKLEHDSCFYSDMDDHCRLFRIGRILLNLAIAAALVLPILVLLLRPEWVPWLWRFFANIV